MKFNKILMGLGAAAALFLGACSSDEPTNPGGNTDDAEYSDKYITVSVMMPTTIGSRAVDDPYTSGDNNFDKYDQGTTEESAVTNAFFLFFDTNKNVVDIQRCTDTEWTVNPNQSNNPYVTKFGEKDIRLKTGLDYSWVAVLLNSSLDVSTLRARIKDLASLEAYAADYVGQIAKDGSNQLMSNSVYFNTGDKADSYSIKPEESQRVILVEIKEENKYKEDAEKIIPVEVYVERIAARVDVKMTIDLDKETKSVNNFSLSSTESVNTLILYDNVKFTQREVEVVPVLNGVMLDVLTPTAKLIKPLEVDAVGYTDDVTNYNAFQWNDPTNRRSYWATTADFFKNTGDKNKDMKYYDWKTMSGKGLNPFKQYIHPNTQAFEPETSNEDRSMNTKVVVAATLMYKDGEKLEKLDLVQFGAEYMFKNNFLMQVASVANTYIRGIDWTNATMEGNEEEGTITFTKTEASVLNVAINNSFLGYEKQEDKTYKWIGLTDAMFGLGKKIFDKPAEANGYESQVVAINPTWTIDWSKDKFDDYEDEAVKSLLADDEALKALAEKAAPFIEKTIIDAVDHLNESRILHWNDGMTYYYYVIRHQGFYGLVGNASDNFVYGVVRNHIYDVDLQAIYGLGTPVINPGDPIDPERPSDQEAEYIKARINILPWRVVKNNATLH